MRALLGMAALMATAACGHDAEARPAARMRPTMSASEAKRSDSSSQSPISAW